MQDVFITFFHTKCWFFVLFVHAFGRGRQLIWCNDAVRQAISKGSQAMGAPQASKQASNTKRNEESNTKHTFRLQSVCQLSLAVT